MAYRVFFRQCILIISLIGGIFPAKVCGQTSRPNILFILADDLGYGDLACYGHREIKTPHLDQLGKEGMKFTHFYSPSPLCSPARAGMLTGRTPFRTGIKSWIPQGQNIYLRREEITLGTLLRNAGYQTFALGKWHLNGGLDDSKHSRPEEHGFEYWMLNHAFALPTTEDPNNFFKNGKALGTLSGFSAQLVADEAFACLENRNPEKPFFMYIPLNEPHSEIASPDDFLKQYQDFTRGEIDLDSLSDRGPGEYYANISFLDQQVGRLLQKLDELGLRDNTLVIFTSDNGPVTPQWRYWWELNMYGSTGGLRGRKADLFEGGIRVPCIIRYPGQVAANSVSAQPVHGYDLLPTICGLLDIAIPQDRVIDGEDFGSLLLGQGFERKSPLFWAFETRSFDDPEGYYYALRQGKWKLICDKQMKKTLLYNLETDPYELREMSQKNPEIRKELLLKVRAFAESIEKDRLRPK